MADTIDSGDSEDEVEVVVEHASSSTQQLLDELLPTLVQGLCETHRPFSVPSELHGVAWS